MAIIIFIGGLGNAMVILAVRTTKKLQTASNAFVVNLSVCDLVFVSIILPFNIYTYVNESWNLPPFLCKIIGFLAYTLTGTTILTITMIAHNRFKLVVYPQNYQQFFQRNNLILMLGFSWLFPVCLLLPAVFEIWGRFGFVTMLVTCNLLLDEDSQSFKLFLLIVRAVIPCTLIVFFYLRILFTTKASHRRVRRRQGMLSPVISHLDQMIQQKEGHLTTMMLTIFAVFFFSYFPCTVTTIIDSNTMLPKRFHMFCLITVYVGSAINPLIYGLLNTQFRSAYYTILLCRCFSSSTFDDFLPTTSASPSSFRRRPTKRKSKKNPISNLVIAKSQNELEGQFLVPATNKASCTPLTSTPRESTDNLECSRLTANSSQSNVCKFRKLSVDSNGFTPLSHSNADLYIHRSNTQKSFLGDKNLEDVINQDFVHA